MDTATMDCIHLQFYILTVYVQFTLHSTAVILFPAGISNMAFRSARI